MGIYALDIYNKAYYGTDLSVEFTVDPFIADQSGYDELNLTWNTPSVKEGSQLSRDWTALALVRNQWGFPISFDDGLVLYQSPKAGMIPNYLDKGVRPGFWQYYALFLSCAHSAYDPNKAYSNGDFVSFDSKNWLCIGTDITGVEPGSDPKAWEETTVQEEWVRAGVAIGLPVIDWMYSNQMYSYIPRPYKTELIETTSSNPDWNNHLWKFTRIFGFGFDVMKTEHTALLRINDTLYDTDGQLRAAAYELGVGDELPESPELRRLRMRNAVAISNSRGTLDGIKQLIQDSTGWGAEVTTGPNLLLDNDQAAFVNPVLPGWDQYTIFDPGVRVAYQSNIYEAKKLAFGSGQHPSGDNTDTDFWKYLAPPVQDLAAEHNPTTLGISTWYGYPTPGGFDPAKNEWTAVNGVAYDATQPDDTPRNCLAFGAFTAALTSILMQSAAPFASAAWDPAVQYETGNVVSRQLGTTSRYFIALLDSVGLPPELHLSHWDPYTNTPDAPLAIEHGVPIPEIASYSPDRLYAVGDQCTANGEIYSAIKAQRGFAPPNPNATPPEDPKHDNFGWAWVGSLDRPYTASLWVPELDMGQTASAVITWFDVYGNTIATVDPATTTGPSKVLGFSNRFGPTTGWTRVWITATAPIAAVTSEGAPAPAAAYAAVGLRLTSLKASAVFYIDRAQFETSNAGTSILPSWAEGYDDGLSYTPDQWPDALWERVPNNTDPDAVPAPTYGSWSGHFKSTDHDNTASYQKVKDSFASYDQVKQNFNVYQDLMDWNPGESGK